mmetsp:Transcript_53289/g.163934  ORF Transcript_53289/g.163934 Transcript_53289/m.163934 type:complete len:246 (+) Transcript_53289:1931-2668(+)
MALADFAPSPARVRSRSWRPLAVAVRRSTMIITAPVTLSRSGEYWNRANSVASLSDKCFAGSMAAAFRSDLGVAASALPFLEDSANESGAFMEQSPGTTGVAGTVSFCATYFRRGSRSNTRTLIFVTSSSERSEVYTLSSTQTNATSSPSSSSPTRILSSSPARSRPRSSPRCTTARLCVVRRPKLTWSNFLPSAEKSTAAASTSIKRFDLWSQLQPNRIRFMSSGRRYESPRRNEAKNNFESSE